MNMSKALEGKGHVIYTDNFYTSPTLAYNLRQRGIGLVGTVRTNRKGYPKDLAAMKKKDLQRGEFQWRMSGDLLAVVWLDKRIHFLSSVHK